MSEVKICCKNCNAHSHRWYLYDKWKNIMSEEEMEKERECENFSPTLAALAKETDGKICIVVDDDFIKELNYLKGDNNEEAINNRKNKKVYEEDA